MIEQLRQINFDEYLYLFQSYKYLAKLKLKMY